MCNSQGTAASLTNGWFELQSPPLLSHRQLRDKGGKKTLWLKKRPFSWPSAYPRAHSPEQQPSQSRRHRGKVWCGAHRASRNRERRIMTASHVLCFSCIWMELNLRWMMLTIRSISLGEMGRVRLCSRSRFITWVVNSLHAWDGRKSKRNPGMGRSFGGVKDRTEM